MKSNEIFNYIIKSFNEKKNSHAFLVETNNNKNCLDDIIKLIKKINCHNGGKEDCKCNICRTIDAKTNPDVYIISTNDKEIKRENITNMMNLFQTKPLINDYKIYVINEVEKLNTSSSNSLLKFIEEPSPGIIGFFITNKIDDVLPTIKSRCDLYNIHYGSDNLLDLLNITDEDFSEYYDVSLSLIDNLENLSKFKLMNKVKKIAVKERKDIIKILKLILKIYTIKFENLLNKKYEDKEYAKIILNSIKCENKSLLANRIKVINSTINDINLNGNKELNLDKMILMWE